MPTVTDQGKIFDARDAQRVAQHPLGGKDDQRAPEWLVQLAAQQVKQLGRGGRVDDLQIVIGTKLQVALDACARMFGSLTFVAVG